MKKIYILDNHLLFCQLLVDKLNSDGKYKVVGFSSHKEEFYSCLDIRSSRPDILIVDMTSKTSEIDLDIIKTVKNRRFQIKILALCSDIDLYIFSQLIKLDIHGLLVKSCDFIDLSNALNSLSENRKYVYPKLIPLINSYMIADNFENKKFNELTLRELDVLKLLSSGLTNKEISCDLCISERTVKNHIFNIFKKIDCSDRTQATLFVLRNHLFDNR